MRKVSFLVALLVGLAGTARCTGPVTRSGGVAEGLVVRRGEFVERFLLTGTLDSVRAEQIAVPRTPTWAIAIRWMESDGAVVAAGQKVIEFDNTAFAGDLEEKKLALTQAENDRVKAEADAAAQMQDREFTLAERLVGLEKAETDAAVPEELLERRKYQERQLVLKRARSEHDKANEDLESYKRSSRSELETRRIALEKARREIDIAERAIEALVLRAPRAGILVVAEHPWEDRKFQVGDTVYVGWTVMRIPDLSAMKVEAQLSDVDDGRIAVGMSAACTLDTYPDLRFPGTVAELTPVAQEPARQSLRRGYHVVVNLDKTDRERMRPGMSVKVEIEARRLRDVIVAPRAALDLASAPARALLQSGGTAEVKLGPCDAQECVVESGLAEGARLRARG